MSGKPAELLPQAERDLKEATVWYREQGGEALAVKWADQASTALRHVGAHPRTGSTRYAHALNIGGLRFWPVNGFPYLIFYVEHEFRVTIWRALHEQHEIPAWIAESR